MVKEGVAVRMAELSRRSGVTVATIKYYLREGLLPRGERTHPNQASYGDEHVQRLHLIRVLVDAGGLSLDAVRGVLDALEQAPTPLPALVRMQDATSPATALDADDDAWAQAQVGAVLETAGWQVHPDSPAVARARTTAVALRDAGQTEQVGLLHELAGEIDQIARRRLEFVAGRPTRTEAVAAAAIGTVLGRHHLLALLSLAEQHHGRRTYPPRGSGGVRED